MIIQQPKILVVVGPTAAGKSALAVRLAKKFGGEIVSADSRQVYRGMDLGTGKVAKKEMGGIPHHLLDVADPKRHYSVNRYQQAGKKAVDAIRRRGKVPIIVGGTGFYIQALVDGLVLPKIKVDLKLRKNLEKKTVAELFTILQKRDPKRAKDIDRHNPRRLIRAIEIATASGAVPPLTQQSRYRPLFLGIKMGQDTLRQKIARRLTQRFKRGLIAEVKKLRQAGLSWKRLESFGLEYKFIALFLQKKISQPEMTTRLNTAIGNYAKRQMTWFKRDHRIIWTTNNRQAFSSVKKFLGG